MSQRAEEIAARVESLKKDLVAFVEGLSDEDWKQVCQWEGWTVGVTARHLGAGHFGMTGLLRMVVDGKDLPQLTMDDINANSKKDAQAHSDCTKEEVLGLLRENGTSLAGYIADLSDDDLDRKGSMPAFGGEAATEQFVEYVIFQSAAKHFQSMKDAVGR